MKGKNAEGARRSGPWVVLKVWGPAVTWAAVLFLLSEISTLPRSDVFSGLDKAAHLTLYSVLGATLGWTRHASAGVAPHWLLVGLGWMYGAVDEWHQSFVPRRSPDPADWVVDAVGVVIGYVFLLILARRISDHRNHGRGP